MARSSLLVILFFGVLYCGCGSNGRGSSAAVPSTVVSAPGLLTAVGYGVDCPAGSQPFAGGQAVGYGTEYVCLDSGVITPYGDPDFVERHHGVRVGKLCDPQIERPCGKRSFCQAVENSSVGFCRRF